MTFSHAGIDTMQPIAVSLVIAPLLTAAKVERKLPRQIFALGSCLLMPYCNVCYCMSITNLLQIAVPSQRLQTSDVLTNHISPFCYIFLHKHSAVDYQAEWNQFGCQAFLPIPQWWHWRIQGCCHSEWRSACHATQWFDQMTVLHAQMTRRNQHK